MRLYDFLDRLMYCTGISEKDFTKALKESSDHGILTDEQIFTISRYINNLKGIKIFFSRKVGTVEIRPKFFDIAVDWEFVASDKTIRAAICLNLNRNTLFVELPNSNKRFTIDSSLLDVYEKDKLDQTSRTILLLLNDLLTRYYSNLLYNIYRELRRSGNI